MTEVGKPDAVPEVEIQPLYDPVPRTVPKEIPVEPELPEVAPSRKAPKREPVPA